MSFRKAVSVARIEYIKWISNPRMIILAVLAVFIYNSVLIPLIECSKDMNSPINILESFIAITNSGLILLLIPVVFITLIADFPRNDGNMIFVIKRTGKVSWLCGQILFITISIISFLCLTFLLSALPIVAESFIGKEWSIAVTEFTAVFPEKSGSYVVYLLPANLYNNTSLTDSFIYTITLLFLYIFSLSTILLMFSIKKQKQIGFIITGGIIALGVAVTSTKASLMWFFPMPHSIVWLHFNEYYREKILPLWCSYAYFFLIILTFAVLSFVFLKKANFESVSEID
jgi:hypothetical protein